METKRRNPEAVARLIFAGMGLLLFLLLEGFALRFTLVSFRYEILENRLLIVRVFRRREKPVLSLPLKEINAIVGTITDARGLYVGNKGELNGIVIGDRGRARIETIGAGGYNIQCFHFRTLIHEIK